jgi:hypothetical protein
MKGELLWFNEARQDGLIEADDGARLPVFGHDFADGEVPVGRCAGTPVTFEVQTVDGEDRATLVRTTLEAPVRRARMRSQRR